MVVRGWSWGWRVRFSQRQGLLWFEIPIGAKGQSIKIALSTFSDIGQQEQNKVQWLKAVSIEHKKMEPCSL